MKNIEMTTDDDQLVIKVDLSKSYGPSRTGKTTIVASTEGPHPVPNGEAYKVNLTVWRK